MLTDGDFSNLKIINIYGKMIYVFDKHHFALPVWALATDRNNRPYNLITFDYHTDTLFPFHDFAFLKAEEEIIQGSTKDKYALAEDNMHIRISNVDTMDIHSLLLAVEDLCFDEHITTAHELGIINEYHVINKYSNEARYEDEYLYMNNYINYENGDIETISCIDDKYIEQTAFKIPLDPYILDFDLDYFPRRSSFITESNLIISQIIKNAEIITIARERECFDNLKHDNYNILEAEELLLEYISTVLQNN